MVHHSENDDFVSSGPPSSHGMLLLFQSTHGNHVVHRIVDSLYIFIFIYIYICNIILLCTVVIPLTTDGIVDIVLLHFWWRRREEDRSIRSTILIVANVMRQT
jgi:uncharacterized membrane protein